MEQGLTREYLDEKLDNLSKKVDEKFDDFAKIVADGFDSVQDQFREVYRKIDNLDNRLDETNSRIDKLYNLVDGFIGLHQKLDQEFTAIRARYERLEERIAKLEAARA